MLTDGGEMPLGSSLQTRPLEINEDHLHTPRPLLEVPSLGQCDAPHDAELPTVT